MPKVTFSCPSGQWSTEAAPGTSLLEAAQMCQAPVGHSCGGACACSSCHVWVRAGLSSLTEAPEEEADRLDQAFDVRPHSRLACQACLGPTDVQVWITEESHQAYQAENPGPRP